MISGFLSGRRALFATLASAVLVLAGCSNGGGDGGGNTTFRVLNLTTDLPSLDVYTNDVKGFGGITTDTLGPNLNLVAATYTLSIKSVGEATTLVSGSYTLSKDKHYTGVVWGRSSGLRLATLPEDENTTDITTGATRVRVYNATVDSGTLDVFIGPPGADLAEAIPTQASLTVGSLAGFREITAGTYRLRVTGAGDPTDVRLDVPSIVLGEKQFNTLILTATGVSGVLLNGTLLAQQGDRVTMKNTKARVRLAASVGNNGIVSATVGGVNPFTGAYRSPRVSAGYALVDSGSQVLNVTVNGTAINGNGAQTFAAGSDYTLLVYGAPTAGQAVLLTDDNRAPTATTRAKIRLINGLQWADLLTLRVDGQSFSATSDIPPGGGTGYATPLVAGSTELEVTSTSALLFTKAAAANTALLASQGIYNVFILDGDVDSNGNPAAHGYFIRDR